MRFLSNSKIVVTSFLLKIISNLNLPVQTNLLTSVEARGSLISNDTNENVKKNTNLSKGLLGQLITQLQYYSIYLKTNE